MVQEAMRMDITLRERTAETVREYFIRANTPEIKAMLPQRAKTVEEALVDYEKTLLPTATSYGKTIWVDDVYVGDIWCYCIDLNDEPNTMISYCIFNSNYYSKGIATEAVNRFIAEICKRFPIQTIGSFTFLDNIASIRVLEKNGFTTKEQFEEGGKMSVYLQLSNR